MYIYILLYCDDSENLHMQLQMRILFSKKKIKNGNWEIRIIARIIILFLEKCAVSLAVQQK